MSLQNLGARRAGAACLAAGVAVLLAAAPASASPASAAPTASAAARVKSGPKLADCAKLARSARRACQRQNAANRYVYLKLRNSQLIGNRGSFSSEDWLFCTSGKAILRSTSGGSTGISEETDWAVEEARTRNGGKWFEAAVTTKDRTQVGVAMRGGRWQVATYSLGSLTDMGPATRTDATAACAKL